MIPTFPVGTAISGFQESPDANCSLSWLSWNHVSLSWEPVPGTGLSRSMFAIVCSLSWSPGSERGKKYHPGVAQMVFMRVFKSPCGVQSMWRPVWLRWFSAGFQEFTTPNHKIQELGDKPPIVFIPAGWDAHPAPHRGAGWGWDPGGGLEGS